MENKLPYVFKDDERKILFNSFDLPAPWINYLSNGRMHSFVSQAGGGLCWWLSPMIFRLTRYRFYNLPVDSPGFYIYIRLKDGYVFSPTFRPVENKVDYWTSAHAPGYSEFIAQKDGLKCVLKLFVSQDTDTLIWNLELTNENNEDIDFDVFAYTEFSEYVFLNEVNVGYYLKWMIKCSFDKESDSIMYINHNTIQPRMKDSPIMYFGASEKVTSFTCDRDSFCGYYRDERNPEGVEKGVLDNTEIRGGEGCGALHVRKHLKGKESKTVNFFLGVSKGALVDYKKAVEKARKDLEFLRKANEVDNQFNKNMDWWNEHLGVYQCVIPDKDSERQINIWNPLQSVTTARFSRSISTSASGIRGIGFRDTAQDMLAQAYRKPDWAKKMLLYLTTQQFKEGHTVHQSWPEDNKLPQVVTRSDNHLWMVYLAYAIISETGDLSLLDEVTPFIGEDLKSEVEPVTVFEHLMRGIEFTENHLGEHGLPLILFSDWNDHFGTFGRKGKGESLFVNQQLIYALKELRELSVKRNDTASVDKITKLIEKHEKVNKDVAWDKEWYIRGYDDEGNRVGIKSADEDNIWINTQSWEVIAGAGNIDEEIKAMDSVKTHLDTEYGLRINKPSYPTYPETQNPKVNGATRGYSENSGIFCQANCWAIFAECILKRPDNAWKYYRQLIPHILIQKMGLDKYQKEAYAYPSTLMGPDNEKFGMATVTQVTGTAAWMDVVSTQYMLGVRPKLDGLLIDPCVPKDWDGYKVTRIFRGVKFNIEVKNNSHEGFKVKEMNIDGKKVSGNLISEEYLKDKKERNVLVIL